LKFTATDSLAATSDEMVVTVNQSPVVSAGANFIVNFPGAASLNGTATDDGLPFGGSLAVRWNKVSGPGSVTFTGGTSSTASLNTSALFSLPGVYVLRLIASDSLLTASDDVAISQSISPEGRCRTKSNHHFSSARIIEWHDQRRRSAIQHPLSTTGRR
jgi:hypothetical protein